MILGRSTYTVTRRSAGSYDGVGISDGHWSDGAETTFDVELSIQPLRPDEQAVLAEGMSSSEAFKAYGNGIDLHTVQTAGLQRCDLVTVEGRKYAVNAVSGFAYHKLNHRKYVLTRFEIGANS